MPADEAGLEFDDELDMGATTGKPRPAAKRAAGKPARKPVGVKGPKGARPGARRSGERRPNQAPPRKPKRQVTVSVVGLDRTFQVPEGTDLRMACRENHVNLFWGPWAQAFNCRGVATCGLCKVAVVEGQDNLEPRSKREEKRLRGKPDAWRLACHAKLTGDVRIDPFPRVPVDERVSEEAVRRALMTEEERQRLRDEAKAARQAEREKDKDVPAKPKERKGLLGRFKKENEGKAEKKGKSDKGQANKRGSRKEKDAPRAGSDDEAGTASDAAAKPSRFGLKGRKS